MRLQFHDKLLFLLCYCTQRAWRAFHARQASGSRRVRPASREGGKKNPAEAADLRAPERGRLERRHRRVEIARLAEARPAVDPVLIGRHAQQPAQREEVQMRARLAMGEGKGRAVEIAVEEDR